MHYSVVLAVLFVFLICGESSRADAACPPVEYGGPKKPEAHVGGGVDCTRFQKNPRQRISLLSRTLHVCHQHVMIRVPQIAFVFLALFAVSSGNSIL